MHVRYTGFDERAGVFAETGKRLSPLDDLKAVVEAVSIPVQAVGGLSLEEAISAPYFGALMVVIGAPLAIDAHALSVAGRDLRAVLSEIVRRINS
jgi:3-hexulose-6-phosphate synthase